MVDSVVFLGCGQAARIHTRTLRRIAPRVQRYYASRLGDKARELTQKLKGAGSYGGYQSALADSRADVAIIVTPPLLHFELALQALRAGKHVIVEKPAFMTTEECDRVADAAAAAGRQVLVAENYYYKPLAEALREILASGRIGSIRLLQLNALKWQRPTGWRADPALAGGGPLFEGGIHWISLLNNLGPQITHLESRQRGPELTTVSTAYYEDGGRAVLRYSWESRSRIGGVQLSRLYGTHGLVTFESNGLFVREGRRLSFPALSDLAGYQRMFVDFLDALAHDRPPRFTFARARRDIELIRNVQQPQA